MRFVGEPGDVADLDQQACGAGGADAVQVHQGGAGGDDQLLELLVSVLGTPVDPLEVADQFRGVDGRAIAAAAGPVDAVVDTLGAVPSPDPTMAGYDAIRPDGTWTLVGGVRQDLPIPYGDFMHRRLTLRGSWMCRDTTVSELWSMIRSGVIDLSVLDVTGRRARRPRGGAHRGVTLTRTTDRCPGPLNSARGHTVEWPHLHPSGNAGSRTSAHAAMSASRRPVGAVMTGPGWWQHRDLIGRHGCTDSRRRWRNTGFV
ncbi:zinc-binding dehydrogenase [Actinoallomurus rhizosphaericola]|uniref:zinc-binding dehydrogenase n=1 Tax=Actinoallomurus rhizosphaericola TaxID=2952536 RepID=UPI003873883A